MIQATGSNAGKSTIVAGLARALVRRGLKVAPFKPQNMSNNAAVDGRGRRDRPRPGGAGARGAAGAERPHEPGAAEAGDRHRRAGDRAGPALGHAAREELSGDARPTLLPAVLESFAQLARDADIVLVEGAGSPAEINLRAGDIANMGFAAAADVPVRARRRHRPRRRHRQPRRHACGAGAGRSGRASTASSINKFRGDAAPVR